MPLAAAAEVETKTKTGTGTETEPNYIAGSDFRTTETAAGSTLPL